MFKTFIFLFLNLFSIILYSQDDCLYTDERWQDIKKYAIRNEKIIFLDFYAPWCVPCKKMDANTYPDPEVKQITCNDAVVSFKVNMGYANGNNKHPDAEYLSSKYNIQAYPTMIFLMPDGTELFRTTGYKSPEDFIEWFQEQLKEILEE